MFVKSKPLPIHTKIWRDAGLDFLLIADKQRQEQLKTKSIQDSSQLVKNIYQNIQKVAQAEKADNLKNNLQNQALIVQNISPRSSEEARELRENELVVDARGNANPSLVPILKDFEWSEEWESLYNKVVRSSTPKIAWTYAGMHDDILRNTYSNANRQEIMRDLVKNLNYTKAGVNVFVPFDTPTESPKLWIDTKKNDAVFYWSALYRLKVKILFVFGEEARETLLLKKSRKYASFMHNAHAFYKVYYLPDVLSLSDKSERNTLLTYLNQQLTSFGI